MHFSNEIDAYCWRISILVYNYIEENPKLDLAHLQAFHMRCQRLILGVWWQDHVTNKAIHKRTSQPHIGQLIQAQKHSLFGHVVRLLPSVPCNAILRLTRDISMGHRIPSGWRRPRGWPRTLWTSQLKKDTGVRQPHPGAALWTVNSGGRTQRTLRATRYDDDDDVIRDLRNMRQKNVKTATRFGKNTNDRNKMRQILTKNAI